MSAKNTKPIMERIHNYIFHKVKGETIMEELEMMEQQAEEVTEETTEIEPIAESSDEIEQKNELTGTEVAAGLVVAGALLYGGYMAGKYITKKALIPLAKKGVSKVKSLFSRRNNNETIVETDATVVAVEEENSDSDETKN